MSAASTATAPGLLSVAVGGVQCFHGSVSRGTAATCLGSVGDFLIRENPQLAGQLAISVRATTADSVARGVVGSEVLHFNIFQDVPGKFRFDGAAFSTVSELVGYYRENGFSISSQFSAKLLRPVAKGSRVDERGSETAAAVAAAADIAAARTAAVHSPAAYPQANVAMPSAFIRSAKTIASSHQAPVTVFTPEDRRLLADARLNNSNLKSRRSAAVGLFQPGSSLVPPLLPPPGMVVKQGSRTVVVEHPRTAPPPPPPPRSPANEHQVRSLRSPDLIARATERAPTPPSAIAKVESLDTPAYVERGRSSRGRGTSGRNGSSYGESVPPVFGSAELQTNEHDPAGFEPRPPAVNLGTSHRWLAGNTTAALDDLSRISMADTSVLSMIDGVELETDDEQGSSVVLSRSRLQSETVTISRHSLAEPWGIGVCECPGKQGIEVKQISRDSPAAGLLAVGDRLFSVNGKDFRWESIGEAAATMMETMALKLLVWREQVQSVEPVQTTSQEPAAALPAPGFASAARAAATEGGMQAVGHTDGQAGQGKGQVSVSRMAHPLNSYRPRTFELRATVGDSSSRAAAERGAEATTAPREVASSSAPLRSQGPPEVALEGCTAPAALWDPTNDCLSVGAVSALAAPRNVASGADCNENAGEKNEALLVPAAPPCEVATIQKHLIRKAAITIAAETLRSTLASSTRGAAAPSPEAQPNPTASLLVAEAHSLGRSAMAPRPRVLSTAARLAASPAPPPIPTAPLPMTIAKPNQHRVAALLLSRSPAPPPIPSAPLPMTEARPRAAAAASPPFTLPIPPPISATTRGYEEGEQEQDEDDELPPPPPPPPPAADLESDRSFFNDDEFIPLERALGFAHASPLSIGGGVPHALSFSSSVGGTPNASFIAAIEGYPSTITTPAGTTTPATTTVAAATPRGMVAAGFGSQTPNATSSPTGEIRASASKQPSPSPSPSRSGIQEHMLMQEALFDVGRRISKLRRQSLLQEPSVRSHSSSATASRLGASVTNARLRPTIAPKPKAVPSQVVLKRKPRILAPKPVSKQRHLQLQPQRHVIASAKRSSPSQGGSPVNGLRATEPPTRNRTPLGAVNRRSVIERPLRKTGISLVKPSPAAPISNQTGAPRSGGPFKRSAVGRASGAHASPKPELLDFRSKMRMWQKGKKAKRTSVV
jgi:hypothetical protein